MAGSLAAVSVHAQPVETAGGGTRDPARDLVFAYDAAPLRRVAADAERRAGLRILARDAVLDRCTVTLRAVGRAAFLDALARALAPQGVRVDVRGDQVLLVETGGGEATAAPVRMPLAGRVRDAATGASVPYASVTWTEEGALKGVSAGPDGLFDASLPPGGARVEVASVGYRAAARAVAAGASRLDIALTPVPVPGAETVVVGWRLDAALDTALAAVASRRSAPGTAEPSVRRALEAFPSVGVGAAFAEGPRVRGLRADGFEVLLDGVPVYNPTHLFGLYDAFNPDALDPVAFYYDAAPARFAGPPAGTLAFATRRGAADGWETSAAAGSIAARATVGGPIGGPIDGPNGREGVPGVTVLVAGRASLVGRVPFPGSEALLRTGLDAGRETSAVPGVGLGGGPLGRRVVTPLAVGASFADGHVRIDRAALGGEIALSVYAGDDRAESAAERTLPVSRADPRPVTATVETRSAWGSAVGSLAYTRADGPWRTALSAGVSRYHARFGKDDFSYPLPGPVQPGGGPRPLAAAFDTLGYRNALLDVRAGVTTERAAVQPGGMTRWSVGFLATRYATRYEEQAARAPRTVSDARTLQLDAFADGRLTRGPLALDGGVRVHRFGDLAVQATPRLRATVEAGPVAVFGAVHRGVQFLHRLYFDGQPGASVWVTTAPGERPTVSEGASVGMSTRLGRRHVVQAEAYARRYTGLRQHATSAVVLRRGASVTFAPWASDVAGRGRGLEVLYRGALPLGGGALDLTAAYTLARMDLDGPAGSLRASDDRTHQARVGVSAALPFGVGLDLTAAAASGVPDPLDTSTAPGSLGPYHRLDGAVRVARRVGGARVRVALSVYNLLDRQNPLYREAVPVMAPGRPQQLALVPVDVDDLGATRRSRSRCGDAG